MMLARRGLLGAFLAAPAVILTPGLLMRVSWQPDWENWCMYSPGMRNGAHHLYLSNRTIAVGSLWNASHPMVVHFEHGPVVRLAVGEALRDYVCPTPRDHKPPLTIDIGIFA